MGFKQNKQLHFCWCHCRAFKQQKDKALKRNEDAHVSSVLTINRALISEKGY